MRKQCGFTFKEIWSKIAGLRRVRRNIILSVMDKKEKKPPFQDLRTMQMELYSTVPRTQAFSYITSLLSTQVPGSAGTGYRMNQRRT